MGTALRIRSPVDLANAHVKAIDSNVTVWEGRNIRVVVDQGLFCDPLTSYGDRPNSHMSRETIGGRPARVVSFPLDDGSHFAAAHFEVGIQRRGTGRAKLTISVTGGEELGGEVPLKIVRSVEFI